MADFLDTLAQDARKTISEGHYKASTPPLSPPVSLKEAILGSRRVPIITEIKVASPSLGTIRKDFDPEGVARAMERGGAVGISVLTEPRHFKGSLASLTRVRRAVRLPILMKDIILSPVQLEVASKVGANAVLLIEALFERGYCEYGIHEMIAQAHSKNLEVLLETRNEDEFRSAINSDADLIGINNRDLGTLRVDLGTTKRILEKTTPAGELL